MKAGVWGMGVDHARRFKELEKEIVRLRDTPFFLFILASSLDRTI
jgi:hypothetical protein